MPTILVLCVLGAAGPCAVADETAPPPAPATEPAAAAEAPAAVRTSRLQGIARIDRNRRVIGAVVVVRSEDDPSRVWVTSTDGDGAFRIDGLADGSYEVRLEREGFGAVVKRGVGVRAPFRAVVEVTMVPPAAAAAVEPAPAGAVATGEFALRGRALDLDGKPVPEARLRLTQLVGALDPRSTESGADGAFELGRLSGGPWRLEAGGVGYLPLRAALDLGADSQLELRLVRQPADYEASALELLPEETPIPPPGLLFEPGAPRPVEPASGDGKP